MSKSQTGSQEVVGAAALADALENLEKAPAPPSPKKPAAADPAAPNTEEAASLLSRLTDHYLQIIANRAPIGGAAAWAWRPYTGKNPHNKHVHISVRPEKEFYDLKGPWSL